MKHIATFSIIAFVALAFVVFGALEHGTKPKQAEFLRMHIMANSNTDADARAKFIVKDTITREIDPLFLTVKTLADAINILTDNLLKIETAANAALELNSFPYSARVAVRAENFPTRSYTSNAKTVTIPSGKYDALVVELGAAGGDNWFCCMYPPICADQSTAGESVKYKSKIFEAIKKHF